MNPPSICPRSTKRRNGIANVFDDVGSQEMIVAREAVHFHFGDRGGVSEIVERLAAEGFRIVMNAGRAIEALCEQRHALAISCLAKLCERNRWLFVAGRKHAAGGEANRAKIASEERGGNFGQAVAQLGAGISHGSSVQIGAGGRSGRGRIWNFGGVRWHDAHVFEIDTQALGGDLLDLRVQPLSHFGAAMIHLDAAVAVDQHQRAALIKKGSGEGDAEFHGRDGEAAFGMRMEARSNDRSRRGARRIRLDSLRRRQMLSMRPASLTGCP